MLVWDNHCRPANRVCILRTFMLENFAKSISDSSLTQWIQTEYWLWPVLEITHFFGLTLLIGGLIIIDLRMLGFFRNINLQSTHKLIPFVMMGFSLNLATGVLFFYGDPMRYAINIGFQLKMILIIIAGLNAAGYHISINNLEQSAGTNDSSALLPRLIASISLSSWFGVLLLGRLIPYVGTG